MPTVADLGRKVKAKYPEYSDIPDEELGLKIQAKHPGSYDDFSPAPAARPSLESKAPWGVPSSGPHKTFAETVGPESTLGRMATTFGNIAEYLPDEGAQLAVPVEGAIGTFAQRARNLAATIGSGAAVDWGLQQVLPHSLAPYIAHPLGFATSVAVGNRLSPEVAEAMQKHGRGWLGGLLRGKSEQTPNIPAPPKFDPAANTTTAGRKATTAPPIPSKPSQYFKTSGTIPLEPPPAVSPSIGSPSNDISLDGIAQGFGFKSFAKAPIEAQQKIVAAHNKLAQQAGTAPTTVSPEGGGPVPPPPGHVPEHRREHYTKQAEIGHSEATAKDVKIANFLKSQGKTAADVMKMTDAELGDVQRKLGYRPQSGSRSRTFDEFRKHLAAEIGSTSPPK